MHRVIVVGSPRAEGRSAALANELFCACIDECPDDGVSIVSVASVVVAPCEGCDACRAATEPPAPLEEGDPLSPCASVAASSAAGHRCVIADEMDEVRKHLDAADELVVVCPVYFAGAPAQMKALMDRLQPYYWSDLRAQRPRRSLVLHVVGEGGDPHGFEPLIGEVRSAFGVAGFSLELVLDWVGKVTSDGEVTAEADEHPIPPLGGLGGAAAVREAAGATPAPAAAEGDGAAQGSPEPSAAPSERPGGGTRAKLDLGAADRPKKKGGKGSKPGKGAGHAQGAQPGKKAKGSGRPPAKGAKGRG